MDDRTAKGYDDKKLFICVSCGCEVLATKFASQKTIKCNKCKAENRPIDPVIVANALQKNSPKPRHTHNESLDGDAPDGMKASKCIQCGKETFIGKFASHAKTLCSSCKGESMSVIASGGDLKVDLSKIDRSKLPDINEAYVIPTVINNPFLRSVGCPACHSGDMKIIKINDCSPEVGLIITYQCPECKAMVVVSEQPICMMKPVKSHILFNYRGEKVMDMISIITDTRIKNLMEYMYKLLVEHNIPIEGIDVPPILTRGDLKIPTGFTKYEGVEDAIRKLIHICEGFERANREGAPTDTPEGARFIKVSDTLANNIVNDLASIGEQIMNYIRSVSDGK